MNEISIKLRKQAIEKSIPLVEQLIAEGVDRNKIVQTLKRQVEAKMVIYYRRQKEPKPFKNCLRMVADDLSVSADSTAEKIFYGLLLKAGVRFNFQYPIGPYTADYFIPDSLVVELDGPLHDKKHDDKRDKYMRNMGYRILRIPIWVVANDPNAVILEIQNAVKE